jgi:hypothetical protein
MSRSGQFRAVTPRLVLTLVFLGLMVSGAQAQVSDPASLQRSSTMPSGGSVRLTSTMIKAAPSQPAAETAPGTAPSDSSAPNASRPVLNPSSSSFKTATLPKRLSAAEKSAMQKFERAKASFEGFCKDWEHKLAVREHDNIEAIKWKLENGEASGQYLGYSKINSCTCKQSSHGQPIGELTYGEINNVLEGKTVEEAAHSKPKSVLSTETTEIFGFGKKGWEY